DMHHIISDAFSFRILVQDFTDLYSGRKLTPMKLYYKDYSEWRNSGEQKERILIQEQYWLKKLSGTLPVLNIPTDFTRPRRQSFIGSRIEFLIEKEQFAALRELALKEEATIHIVMLGVLYVLLAKLAGQEDILIGTPAAGRNHSDLEKIIGVFINTLVQRNFPTGEKTFLEFLREVRQNSLAAYENQDYPFDELVKKLIKERDSSRNPLFDVMFEMQKVDSSAPAGGGSRIPSLMVKPYPREVTATKIDLDWVGSEREDAIHFTLTYSTKLFQEETVRFIADCYQVLIESIIADEESKIKDLNFTALEKEKGKEKQVVFNF
ncbi:MAG: condensation domain-containing protein, partial [Candidatus Aminicenantes bacterium]|nr:condensation domain-containing protein [Candidatus Aminicenantes bacterium]